MTVTPNAGLGAQFGFAKEDTYGTFKVPTRFIDFLAESSELEIERIESKGLRANQSVIRSADRRPGKKSVSGDVELELWNKGFGLVFDLMLGGTAVSGTDGSNKTFTWSGPGDLPSATLQFGTPDVSGTMNAKSVLGAVVTEWELSAKEDEFVNLKVSFAGRDLVFTEALATATYPTNDAPYTFLGASLSVSGSATDVKAITIKGNNGLDTDRYFLGADKIKKPVKAAEATFEGELEVEFENLTLFNIYKNATEVALVATFANPNDVTQKLTVTMNVQLDGATPTVGGPDIVKLSIPFKAIASSNDASAITFVYTTPDTTL